MTPEIVPGMNPEPQAPLELVAVTVFLGKTAVVIDGRRAKVDQFPDNGPLYVDALQDDGSIERFVGAPFMMKLASPNRIVGVQAKIVGPGS
jgi:hypothetical protein